MIALSTIILLFVFSGATLAATCTIGAKEALKAAKVGGLKHRAIRLGGIGECSVAVEGESFIASASSTSTVHCEFTLFAGKRTSPTWTISRIELTQPSGKHEAELRTTEQEQRAVFAVHAPAGQSVQYVLSEVQISGDTECTSWKAAFGGP